MKNLARITAFVLVATLALQGQPTPPSIQTVTANSTTGLLGTPGNFFTNASNAAAIFTAIGLPAQSGHAGQTLTTDGSAMSWSSAGAGDVVGPSSSVDSEVVLFSGTGGKTIKRASISGLAKLTSGVLSAASSGTDYLPSTGGTGVTTLGTIGTGTWNGTVVAGQYGGTGVANTGKTITLAGNLTTTGAFNTTIAQGATSTLTTFGSTTLPVFSQNITFTGPTAARTVTLPDASFTAARTDAANTFTGHQTIEGVTTAGATGTGNLMFSASPTATGTIAGASLSLSSLTSGRVTFSTTAGLLADASTLTFNSGTGALSATSFVGAGTSLTGIPYTITGTSGQIAASAGTGNITLSIPSAMTGIQSVTGLAGNMTITAGTGNSRTMALQTTTSGGTATTFLTGNADQSTTLAGNLTVNGTGTSSLAGITTFAKGLQLTGAGTSTAGALYKDSTYGFLAQAITGGTDDFILLSPGGSGIIEVPTGTTNVKLSNGTLTVSGTGTSSFAGAIGLVSAGSPTTTSAGQIAFDNNAWATNFGAAQIYNGTANTYLVGVEASDTPTNGQVPTWNTGGTITWETPAGGATLTSTYVGYGSGGNALTGEAAFVYNATTNTATIGAVNLGAGGETSSIGALVDAVDGTTPLNNIIQTVASGTSYTMTTSYASVTFGTTSPVLTLGNAGTYAVYVNVQTTLVSATTTTQSVSFKLRRTNNTAADLTGSTFGSILPVATVGSELGPSISIGPIKYTTANANDSITVQGILSASLGAGSVTASDCTITAIRMY